MKTKKMICILVLICLAGIMVFLIDKEYYSAEYPRNLISSVLPSNETDNINPVLNHPADITCTGDGQNISWVATDNNPDTYEIYLHMQWAWGFMRGETVFYEKADSGTWISELPIQINIDRFVDCPNLNWDLEVNFEIIVTDLYNNSASDSVRVFPRPPPEAGGVPDLSPWLTLSQTIMFASILLVGISQLRTRNNN